MLIKRRLIVFLAVFLVLIILIYQAFNRGISGVYISRVSPLLSTTVSNKTLNKVQKLLLFSNDFSAGNPFYFHLQGVVDIWRFLLARSTNRDNTLSTKAANNYTQSLLIQADNPITWLNLAKVKYILRTPDYKVYLNRALLYGKSTQAVLRVYFDFMLGDWSKMDTNNQNEMLELLSNTILSSEFSIANNGKKLNKILKKHQLKRVLCSKIHHRNTKINAFCALK